MSKGQASARLAATFWERCLHECQILLFDSVFWLSELKLSAHQVLGRAGSRSQKVAAKRAVASALDFGGLGFSPNNNKPDTRAKNFTPTPLTSQACDCSVPH